MTSDDLEQAVKIAKEIELRKTTNRMNDYKPYDYQIESVSPLVGLWKWRTM